MTRARSVAYVYPYSFHYRAAFNERVRARLAEEGIEFHFIYCSDPKFTGPRGDLVRLSWATDTACSKFTVGKVELRYQFALREAMKHDLIIVQQESSLLLNYPVFVLARLFGRKTAYFGHGRNFRAPSSDSFANLFKQAIIGKVDWWFAYTNISKEVVTSTGFPDNKVTVFNNTIDTDQIRAELSVLDKQKTDLLRSNMLGGSQNVGIYIGALYAEKRLPFLFEAADEVRLRVPDFHLIVVGGGIERAFVEEAAARRPWVHYVGPKFGLERTELVSLAKLILMPGSVGLAVVDSFAFERPIVTTDVPDHGPEVAYLRDGVNGVIVKQSDKAQAYADAVVRLLLDNEQLSSLRPGMIASGEEYSMGAMVERFASGVVMALSS
jgi:glycosyltransferase involved in cell wall biosynthesis